MSYGEAGFNVNQVGERVIVGASLEAKFGEGENVWGTLCL